MARSAYQYETSPRKIQPKPKKKKLTKKEKVELKRIEEEKEMKRILAIKYEKKKAAKKATIIMIAFFIILAISYRNSLITERFNEVQSKKSELASIEKTNGQLEVNLKSSLNLKNIENTAKKELGMQKLTTDQKVYVTLPKKDYTESSTKEVSTEEKNLFEKFIDSIFN